MFPRPPPDRPGSFQNLLVLPELAGWTLRRCSLARRSIRLWCRACGRDVVVTPAGLSSTYRKILDMAVEEFTLNAKCETCGAKEAQASQWSLENPADPRPVLVRREHWRAVYRRNG